MNSPKNQINREGCKIDTTKKVYPTKTSVYTCFQCKHRDKKKHSKTCPNYIYCKSHRYWTDAYKPCAEMRNYEKQMNISKNIK